MPGVYHQEVVEVFSYHHANSSRTLSNIPARTLMIDKLISSHTHTRWPMEVGFFNKMCKKLCSLHFSYIYI